MPKSKPTRLRLSLDERHALLAGFRNRGTESAQKYADRVGVSVSNLYGWDKDPRLKAAATLPTVRAGQTKAGKPRKNSGKNARFVDGDSQVDVLQFLVAVAFSKGFLGMDKLGGKAGR